MTKRYKVTGVKVRFGPGFVLELEKHQAEARSHVLKKKKGKLYAVLDTVEFKQDEVIGINKGEIPKSWWDTLEEVDTKKSKKQEPDPGQDPNADPPPPPPEGQYTIKHRHFGKYDVIDPDGNAVTEEPLPKEEAEARAAQLSNEAET